MQHKCNLLLAMLTAVRGGTSDSLLDEYKGKAADLFLRLAENATADRLQTSLHYGRLEAKFRDHGS